jgi:hypothetical protein
MKSSSARTLDVSNDTSINDGDTLSSDLSSSPNQSTLNETGLTNFPQFNSFSAIQSLSIKRAGRLNAASISETEHQALLSERQILLDKKFNGELTRKEANRLEYIRWSLDRIEDAKYGNTLDALEEAISRYENFHEEIKDLEMKLHQSSRHRK